jgi:hypothetical protein
VLHFTDYPEKPFSISRVSVLPVLKALTSNVQEMVLVILFL